jgi:hypothetical protein
MAATLSTRLSITARAVAQLYASGQLTLEQLRAQMERAIAEAHTVALLAGTNGQRNREIDTALREIIAEERAELERLITLLAGDELPDVERRLLAFADALEETRAEGQRLVEQEPLSPLVPIVVGTGLAALLERFSRQQPIAGQPPVTRLPRIDSRGLRNLKGEFERRLDGLADELAAGNLTPDQWHEAMRREVNIIHQVYAQTGGGSASQARIDAQLEFLDGFRGDVEGMTPAAIKRRARMYIHSGNVTLQQAATTAIGMPLLPAYPKDFSTECGFACQCFWQYETLEGNGNWDVFWRLRPADHCIHCPRRASVWSPITIRNGIIQPFETVGVYA